MLGCNACYRQEALRSSHMPSFGHMSRCLYVYLRFVYVTFNIRNCCAMYLYASFWGFGRGRYSDDATPPSFPLVSSLCWLCYPLENFCLQFLRNALSVDFCKVFIDECHIRCKSALGTVAVYFVVVPRHFFVP